MKRLFLFSLSLLLGLSSCGGPLEKVWPGGGGNGNNGGEYAKTPCDDPSSGTDTDQDGINDECELFSKSNPYDADTDNDGIQDPLDCPPSDPECKDIHKGLEEKAKEKLGDANTLASSALAGVAPAGKYVKIHKQKIWLVQNNASALKVPTDIQNLCAGSTNYIAVYFKGEVGNLTSSGELPPNLTTQPIRTLALCMTKFSFKNPNESLGQATQDEATLTLENFTWDKGFFDNNIYFNPKVVNKKSQFQTTLEIKTTSVVSEAKQTANKIKTKWRSVWTVTGDFVKSGDDIDIKPIEVEKIWKRFSPDLLEANAVLGTTGGFED